MRTLACLTLAAAALAFAACGDSGGVSGEPASAATPVTEVKPAATATPASPAKPAVVPAKPYVILLVLDEFPGDALLDDHGRIDPVRYPSFAELAATATWYRNAYSLYDSTTRAVPLIMDGIRPAPGPLPTYANAPGSIFTTLGSRGWRVVASEEATTMCPPRYCRGASLRRPPILSNLMSGRPERFDRWLGTIEPGRPTFWFKHALLPHKPYLYLPSGDRTRAFGKDPLPGMDTVPGFYDEYLTRHNEQRFLLQVGYVDRLLGKLLKRLRDQGMFDQTLIAITADHGIAWQVGVPTRRRVDDHNVEELAPVPFIVKEPGQRRGRVDGALVSTLDMTPTIASGLGLRLGYRHDGRPASSRAVRRRRVLRIPTRSFTDTIAISRRSWKARRARVVARRLRMFGSGTDSLYTGIGPNRALIGTSPGGDVASSSVRVARLAQAGELKGVRRASGIVPAQIAGDLRGGRPGAERDLALAVNGRIEVVGRSFYLRGSPVERFAFNVPEDTLREGANDIELYEVGKRNRLRLIARS